VPADEINQSGRKYDKDNSLEYFDLMIQVQVFAGKIQYINSGKINPGNSECKKDQSYFYRRVHAE
jgi:hypothetical protein